MFLNLDEGGSTYISSRFLFTSVTPLGILSFLSLWHLMGEMQLLNRKEGKESTLNIVRSSNPITSIRTARGTTLPHLFQSKISGVGLSQFLSYQQSLLIYWKPLRWVKPLSSTASGEITWLMPGLSQHKWLVNFKSALRLSGLGGLTVNNTEQAQHHLSLLIKACSN